MNMQRRKRQEEEEKRDNATWLCTFNDLMTLLLTFFVLLFSMSSLDFKKMKTFQASLQGALGILESGEMTEFGVIEQIEPRRDNERSELDSEQEDTEAFVDAISVELGIDVSVTERAWTIVLEDTVLFESGRADINPEAHTILDRIAAWMNKVHFPIRIEGHTDNVPVHTERFPSNWELSTTRAVNVLKYLISAGGVAAPRCSAIGYGDSRPLYPNDTREHRRKNRRVEFVLLKEGKK